LKLDGVPQWLVLREVAIEDVRRARSTHRYMEWYRFFAPIIQTIHEHEADRRKLLAEPGRRRCIMITRLHSGDEGVAEYMNPLCRSVH